MTDLQFRPGAAKFVTAASIAALAASSGGIMLLFLAKFGADASTDGTLAAYSLYVLTTVFAQGCRITGAAAIGGPRPRLSTQAFGWTMAVGGAAAALAFLVLAGPIASVLTASPVAEDSARDVLPVLGLGVAGQFWSIGLAVVLGRAGLVAVASLALAAGGLAALAAFLLLVPSQGPSALGWSTVASGGVAIAAMATGTGRPRHGAYPAQIADAAGLLLVENIVPLFSTTLYMIAVVISGTLPGPGVSQDPGAMSVFALAFLACSYLCGILGTSTAIVDTIALADTTDTLTERLRQTVPSSLRTLFPLGGAALAAGALLGPAVLGNLGPADAREHAELFGPFLLAFVPFTFATLATNVAFSCWFSSRQVAGLNRGLIGALPLAALAIAGLFLAFDLTGAAVGVGISATAFAWWALRPAPGVIAETLRRAIAPAALVGGASATALLLGLWG